MKRKLLTLVIIGGVLLLGHSTAHAIPVLQLYIEGAQYRPDTQSWVAVHGPFRLWTIGNVSGPGGKGTIYDVRLSVTYSSAFHPLTVTLQPAWVGGDAHEYEGFHDYSAPEAGEPQSSYDWNKAGTIWQSMGNGIPTSNWTSDGLWDGLVVTDGSQPVLSDGQILPNHDTFGPGMYWQEFYLGDFTATTDSIADLIPPEDFAGPGLFEITQIAPDDIVSGGQINAYDVIISTGANLTEMTELEPFIVSFDLFNHVGSENKAQAKFAPFSHDAHIAPEPFSGIVWLLIGLTWAGSAWMYRYYSQWQELEQEPVLATATCEGTLALRDEQARTAGSSVRAATAEQHQVND